MLRKFKSVINSNSINTFSVFAGGNLVVAVLGGIGGLIQGQWIGPEVLGEISKYGIIVSYFSIGLVIVNDGLSRQYPYLLAKGDNEGAIKVASNAKAWYLFLCFSFSIVLAILAFVQSLKGNFRGAIGWAIQIPIVFVSIYGAFLGVLYRTSNGFKRQTYNNLIGKLIDFFALVFVYLWGYWGLALRMILGNISNLALNISFSPVKIKASYSKNILISLAKISIPLSAPGFLATSFLTASVSFIIVEYCGVYELGIYGMSLAFQSMALIPISALHQILISKVNHKYGETENFISCLDYIKKPIILGIIGASLMAVLLSISIRPFIINFLPNYLDAIPVIQILSIQLPINAARAPLIIISTALWYKHVFALSLVPLLTTLVAILLFPKNLEFIVCSVIIGGIMHLIYGYTILKYETYKFKNYN